MKIIIAGKMPYENWFSCARVVCHPDGIAPCQTSVGGGNNTTTKILEIVYEDRKPTQRPD